MTETGDSRRLRTGCWNRGLAGFVVLAAALVFAQPALPDSSADGGIHRGAFLWTKTVHGKFEEVIESIRAAAGRKNFPVTNVRNYKESFEKRLAQTGGGKFPYAQYRLLEFCNVSLAIESLRKDARLGVFMPCRIVVYSREGSDIITLMTVNPKFMPKTLHNPELNLIADRVEEVILEIFESVDF